MEQIKDAPMKLFRRKLGLPKFGDGKNGEQEYENSPGSVIYMTPDGAFVNDKGESVNVLNKIGGDNPAMWTFVDEDGKIYTPRMAQDSGTISQGNKHTPLRQLMSKSDRYRYDPLLGAIARLDTKNPFEGILKTGIAQVGPGAALADTYAVLNAIKNIDSGRYNITDFATAAIPALKASNYRFSKTKTTPSPMKLQELGQYIKQHPESLKQLDMSYGTEHGRMLRKFYTEDVIPRLNKQLSKRNKSFDGDIISSTRYSKAPFYGSRYGGFYNTELGAVLNSDIKSIAQIQRILSHETQHSLRNVTGYTPEEASILSSAYPFSAEYLSKNPNVPQLAEQAATNNEIRRMISYAHGGAIGKELDRWIDIMPDEELKALYSSAYGADFAKSFKPGLKMQRYALKAVAGLSPLAINSASDDVAEYNSGKSIHINPANRGKFNALKRRTGKTTEQLTHSKNPLTRKRAIFAQNARKWHHR